MGKWKNTAEVAIIGGGIMGVCTAYYLAKRGQKDVVILEKDLLAQASTGLSVGGVRQQFSEPANILLSQETMRLFKLFKEESNTEIDFYQDGYLFLAQKEETWNEFKNNLKIQHNHNVPVEVLMPEEIKSRWPYLEVAGLHGGTFCAEDGYIDPYRVAMAFAQEAVRMGVRLELKTEVTEIQLNGNQVKGVETTRGSISAPIVVNAAGPWGGEVAKMAGFDLPVKPYRRQVFSVIIPDTVPRPIPMIIDFDINFYFLGYGQGILMGMSDPDEPSSFNTHVDWDFLEKLCEMAVLRTPILEKAEIVRGWGGLYTITPDDNPIIGELPEAEGFFCAIGFSGHGFQHGPSVGRVMSELILDGKTDFDLSPFAHDRFGKMKETGEKRVV